MKELSNCVKCLVHVGKWYELNTYKAVMPDE